MSGNNNNGKVDDHVDDDDDEQKALLLRTGSLRQLDIDQASEVFDFFCNNQAATLKSILRAYRHLCDILRLKPQEMPHFYPKLKAKLNSWKAKALWSKFDKRAGHKCYLRGKACMGQRVLVIGAGPCGLRTAIEAQLLGAKVVVVEKRDRFSRNNVLHLWPYNITDLRGLGAKKFYGKFCAGAIDHISIRALQCILLKVSLLLGVEVFENVGFEDLVEPTDIETGWRARMAPEDHPVAQYEFDVLIGADGKRNTLRGFKRKEFRGKLAIAITANFINRHSEAESQIEEISGVAFIFNQKFFNDLNEAKRIDLENIVYYKDETHYFVMTAKKQSLLDKGVIVENNADTAKLLAADNINADKLFDYAREAADYATNYQMPHLDFAVNHYGKPDVAMFDFTSMFQAENSCRVLERHGHRLLTCLVGDSLLEPFWPTGTGCARGFFGGLDACWLMRSLSMGKATLLEALAERESIYRLLAQTTPETTCKDYASYTVDPHTRYPTLNTKLVLPFQIMHLVDTDNPSQLAEELKACSSTATEEPRKKRRKDSSHVSPDTLLNWLVKQVGAYDDVVISDMTTSFQSGLALCAIIHRYRPDLVDFHALDPKCPVENIQLAFEVLDQDLGISPVMKPTELADKSRLPDKLTMMSYLAQLYECFRKDIPAVNKVAETIMLEEEDEELQGVNKAVRGKYHENGKMSIGQLVARDATRKKQRRSSTNEEDASPHNKENVRETARLNRSANRKRLLRLMERAEASAAEKKKGGELSKRKSIKEEERYKLIEQQFCGVSKRKSGGESAAAKYRENKKPKELKRAIGKIDRDDWNIKNIEDKLMVNTQSADMKKDKVPKWSKAAFQDKFNKFNNKLEDGDEAAGKNKYDAIDSSLAKLQRKLREGSTLEIGERGSNRVSALAEGLFTKQEDAAAGTEQVQQQQSNNPAARKKSAGSETCHFCSKRVYVVERMSAEGKFFHRSCFRCDYCNILLRLGSYVHHREGAFSGKFFCIPHSTENALEKYRYRRKADEIRDSEMRHQRELMHTATNDWGGSTSAPTSYINSIHPSQKERLLSSLDPAKMRGTTPERAEFEASTDLYSEEEVGPSIMDEDEWTDRNFGNSLVDHNNTSEDSVSDLDSDEDDDEDGDNSDDSRGRAICDEAGKPLTAKEARQLQKEWLKKYDPRSEEESDDEEEVSQYENVKKGGRLIESDEEEDEEPREVNYEDGEYEDVSSDSDLDEGCSNIRLSVPTATTTNAHSSKNSRRSRPRHHSAESESTSDDDLSSSSDESDTETSSDSDKSVKSENEFSGSESNTECEFTDSEGRPNPFHKDLEVPKIFVQPGSPDPSGVRRYPVEIHQQQPSTTMTYASQYQYKTPNITGRLKNEELNKVPTSTSVYVGRSTQRALNLKKHWVSEAQTNAATNKKVTDAAEIDNRLKSLMDRLSNQQKLLKPAEKHSTEMEHFLKSSPRASCGSGTGVTTSTLKTSLSTDPLTLTDSGHSYKQFSRQTSDSGSSFSKFYPTPYQSTTTTAAAVVKPSVEVAKETTKEVVVVVVKPYTEIDTIPVPEKQPKSDLEMSSDSSSSTTSSSSSDSTSSSSSSQDSVKSVEENKVPDIKVVDVVKENVTSGPRTTVMLNETTGSSTKDEDFESCNDDDDEEQEANEDTNDDLLYQTPGNDLSLTAEDLAIIDIPLADASPEMNDKPIAASSPLTELQSNHHHHDALVKSPTESEKSFIRREHSNVKLTDDEITRIYQETNPLERLAKFNSLKKKQSNVVHDMILNKSGGSNNRSSSGTRRTRVSVPQSNVPPMLPPPPPPSSIPESPKKLEQLMDFPLIDDGNSSHSTPVKKKVVSLPATPLTDPEKFGIPVARNANHVNRQKNNNSSSSSSSSPSKSVSAGIKSPASPIGRSQSSTSNDMDKMDGIVSSTDGENSLPNSPQKTNPAVLVKKSFMQTLSGIFRGGSSATRMASPDSSMSSSHTASPPVTNNTEAATADSRKSRSDTFLKFAKGALKRDKSTPSSPEAARSSATNNMSLIMQASHPSTPPVPLSRKITITHSVGGSECDSLSEGEEDVSTESSLNVVNTICKNGNKSVNQNQPVVVPPEILEKLMRRGGKTAKRAARVAHLKRVRKAQEIQRQLEELDVVHKDLEERGIAAEQSLRGEQQQDNNKENAGGDLMQTWFLLLAEKNALVRHEQELLVQAKQLELEDRSGRLEAELREHLLLDSRSGESVTREGQILKELLDIAEQRELLQAMLDRDKARYQKEDRDIEAQMRAKGLRLTPIRKLSSSSSSAIILPIPSSSTA